MNIKGAALKPYFVLKGNWFIWSHVLNRNARKFFSVNIPHLNPLQQSILERLRADGIAVTSLSDLFPDDPMLNTFSVYADKLKEGAETKTKKDFLKNFWDTNVLLDFNNPFLQFSLHQGILDVANSYLGMWSKLSHYTLNLTVPVGVGEKAQFSQRWHRDPQEKRMLKIFIYLTDVDEGAGPFTYVKRSTYGNTYGSLFPQKPPAGNYPPDGSVEKNVDPKDIQTMIGKAGTVIFCDTSGLHRGGYATTKERLMFTGFYCAPSYDTPVWYTRGDVLSSPTAQGLSPAAQFALAA